jgi:MoxR-like ATPase
VLYFYWTWGESPTGYNRKPKGIEKAMTSIKFLCKTCKKIVEADELDYLRNSDPHEGHDRVWLQRPTIENPSEVTPSVSIVEKDTFHSDVKEVRNVMGNLNSVIFERQDAIKGLVLALLAREHIIYYGPPGTGKNYMVDRFTQCIDHSFFEYQISQFTVLDELFGSYDLIHMRDTGEMRRVIDGKLLQAEVAFLDEIGNSSSPIRNALKGLMQERKYEYGKTRELAPLQTIVAASNSVLQFEEDATEQAFEDRFLFRDAVGYIQDPANELRMLQLYRQNSSLPVIPHATITRLQNYVREVEFSEEFMKSLIDFKHKIIEEAPGDIAPISDRRMFKLMSAVAAHAVLNGRTKAKRADLAVFQYIFWHDPSSQKLPVQEWVKAHLVSNLDKIDALRSSLNDIFASFEQAQSDDSSYLGRIVCLMPCKHAH